MFTTRKQTPSLSWLNCLSGETGSTAELPAALPGDADRPALALVLAGETVGLEPSGDGVALVNGAPLSQRLAVTEPTTVQLPDALLVVAPRPQQDFASVRTDLWVLFDARTGDQLGEHPSTELLAAAARSGLPTEALACTPVGLEVGFNLAQIAPLVSPPEETEVRPPNPALLAAEQNRGAHVCPVCWTRFDAGDALSIAVHENLRGDPVLGSDARLRFQPTRFNDQGLALDPMGLACTDIACPHCRRQLPPGYLERPHRIISLIGAPSAGKSYYLAVLTRVLPDRLPEDFSLA
ncbi:MAG: hypothetical protein ACO3J6_03940, partial [Opitutales bacterium]